VPRQFDARYRLNLDDYAVLCAACAGLTVGRRILRATHVVLDAALFVAAAIFAFKGEWGFAACFALLGMVVLALKLAVEPWQQRRRFSEQRVGDFEIEFRADDDGFSTRSDLGEGALKWVAVRQVDDLPGHAILWPGKHIGWIVPKRGFATAEAAKSFVAFAKEKTGDSKI
jgi:hypothetical protein